MALQYCGGKPLLAETRFGGGRHTVEVGLAERRTGILCLGAQAAFSGRKRWEDLHPEAAAALRLAALTRRVMASSMRLRPGGRRWMQPSKWPWNGCRSQWIMARKAVGSARNFCSAWWRSAMPLASRYSCCITRPTTAKSHRAVLGHPGIALERDQVGRCEDEAGVGQDNDMEGYSPHRCTQSEGLPKRGDPAPAGDAGGGKPTDAPP